MPHTPATLTARHALSAACEGEYRHVYSGRVQDVEPLRHAISALHHAPMTWRDRLAHFLRSEQKVKVYQ